MNLVSESLSLEVARKPFQLAATTASLLSLIQQTKALEKPTSTASA